jgi:hypothetical protein
MFDSPIRRPQTAKDGEWRRPRIITRVQAGHCYSAIGRERGCRANESGRGTGAQVEGKGSRRANRKLDTLGFGLDIADNPLKTLKTAKGIFGKT